MIPEETIARIRESVDLVGLVRESVPGLKKTGRNFQARCPFHQERTPSFSVNPEMGVFKCFGCGVGGDAFKFLMLTEGLTYPEAIRKLAGRVGITIQEAGGEKVSADAEERQKLYQLLEEAARFYHRQLMESPDAKPVRDYLAGRGVSPETLEKFQLGFAPASGNALRDAAMRKGWSTEYLEKAGLLRRKEGSARFFDHFWNRIIFPIWDSQGRIVAFGGRALGDAMPKYINSPETPVYSKSRHLYGLFQGLAALRKARHIIILEGYMDVAVCHQFGFDTTAATLGTALTPEHIRLLRRYAEQATLIFDPDAAGANATLRGGEMLMVEGFTVHVVTLPDELDPDELLVQRCADKFKEALGTAVSFMDYCLAGALKRHPSKTPEGKLAVAKDLLPLIQKVRDPLLQDQYLMRMADALQIDKAVLARQMKTLKPEAGKAKAAEKPAAALGALLSMEEEILLLGLLYPSEETARALGKVSWQDERCRAAWEKLGTEIAKGTLHLAELLPEIPEELHEWLTSLAMQRRDYADPLEKLGHFLAAWEKQNASQELSRLRAEVDSMIDGRVPLDSRKLELYKDLSRRLKGSLT